MHCTRLNPILLAPAAMLVWRTAAIGQTASPLSGAALVSFIENKGQVHDQNGKPNPTVRFLATLPTGMNIQLRTAGFSYDTYLADSLTPPAPARDPFHRNNHPAQKHTLHFHRVDVEFPGSRPDVKLIASEPTSLHLNFARGTPTGPRTIQASSFRTVTYHDLFPNIDLVFRINPNDSGSTNAEYNFIVHPGGDPRAIRWKYHGANKTSLQDGHIHLLLTDAVLKEHIPASYQQWSSS